MLDDDSSDRWTVKISLVAMFVVAAMFFTLAVGTAKLTSTYLETQALEAALGTQKAPAQPELNGGDLRPTLP